MSNIVLPNIEQAKVTLNENGRVVVRMNDGFVFWDRNDYKDENGEMYEPTPKEVGFSRFGIFSPETDFSTFVVIAESEIPEIPDEPEIPEVPEELETETQATETDYINALKELGVNFNE
jgi:hypothetical protein